MAKINEFLDPVRLHTKTEELLGHAKWTRAQLLEHQRQRLRELTLKAVELSPWYRENLGELVKRDRPLSEFPVLTKDLLMANFDDIVLDRNIRLSDVESHLSSANPGSRYLGKYYAFPTGGTSGVRAIILYDETAWCNQVANIIRFLRQAGLPPGGRVIGIGANSPLHISGRAYAELRHWQKEGVAEIDVTTPIAAIVSALNAYQPDAIITYPSFIRTLASEQQHGRLMISPTMFGAVAESLSDDIRSLARSAWNIEILNRYNATEIGSASSECARPNGIHMPEDLVILESVDDGHQPTPDGVVGRKVLVTTLSNSVQPLIRYELTDLLAITNGKCACGQPFARISSISGRREELLVLPGHDGKVREVPAIYLAAPLVKVPFVRQFQIALKREGIEARLVISDPGAAEDIKRRAHDEIVEVLRNRGVSVPLQVNVVDDIPRQGGGAKIKLVVHE